QDLDDLGRGGIGPPGVVVAVIVVVPLLVQGVLLEVGEQLDPQVGAAGRPAAHIDGKMEPGREPALGAVVLVCREGQLLEVALAAGAVGGRAHLLHRWHEEADEYGDDGDYDQQLDQREAGPSLECEERRHSGTPSSGRPGLTADRRWASRLVVPQR